MATQLKNWQAPDFERSDDIKLGWVKQAIEDGTRWVSEQPATGFIDQGIAILSGKCDDRYTRGWGANGRSSLSTGDLKRAVREIIETLADIRPFWGYQTNNRSFEAQANMMNKITKSLYLECFVDRSLKDALQLAALTGAGFISPFYARKMHGRGKGEFVYEALGQTDVLPVQLPLNRDYQEAYAVTLRRVMPVSKAHALFPLFQSKLAPFAKRPYTEGGDKLPMRHSVDRWRFNVSSDVLMEQYCEIFYTYVLDLRINECIKDDQGKMIVGPDGNPVGKVLEMGQPDTTWSYSVPYWGQQITRWEDGRSTTRSATDDDCRVYPYRRLMISCDQALMYDGPGFNWHGCVPAIPFYLDSWAHAGTGYSLFQSTAELQYAIDALERSMFRISMARVNPGKAYNTDILSKDAKINSKSMESIDPFDPNVVYPVDGDIKDTPLRPPMPEWCYDIPEAVPKNSDRLREMINRQLGLDQIEALQKLRANIQQPEKLLDAEGPVVIGASRGMEQGLRDLGEMTKYDVLQYMPTGKIIQYVGVSSVAPEVFDYDPDTLYPSHMPGETTIDATGQTVPSTFSRYDRAKAFADNLPFFITPHSLHYIAQAEMKLNYLALLGKGIPIDPETLANVFSIPNYGTLDGSTVLEKVLAYKKLQLEGEAELAKMQQGLGLNPPDDSGKGKPGRPSTDKQAPKAKQKGIQSGGRVVVSTSG